MNSYLELIRLGNCLMASIAVIIGFFLTTIFFVPELIVGVFAVFFICAGGQAINDVYDLEIDKKINKNKPIPSGKIKKETAFYLSIILFILGIILSFFVNTLAFLIAIIFSILLFAYASYLYKLKYLGNFIVALGTAFTFIFGSSVTGEISFIVLLVAISAFFANMAREVTKDIEDLKKDKGFKKTLPMVSKLWSNRLIIFYYFLSIGFACATFVIYNLSFIYLFFIWLSTFVFLSALLNLKRNDFYKSQNHSKKGMFLSLIAFISAIFK